MEKDKENSLSNSPKAHSPRLASTVQKSAAPLRRPKTATVRPKHGVAKPLTTEEVERLRQTNAGGPATSLCRVPTNIHTCIFRFLSPQDLLTASQVCHVLRESADQDHIWLSQTGRESRSIPLKYSAKINYLRQRAIMRNYFRPKSKNFKLIGHKKAITSIAIHDDCILTGSNDYYAKYWNLRTSRHSSRLGTKKAFSFEHSDQVTKVMFFHNTPVTASVDHTIRVWSPDTGGTLTLKLASTHRVHEDSAWPRRERGRTEASHRLYIRERVLRRRRQDLELRRPQVHGYRRRTFCISAPREYRGQLKGWTRTHG